MRSGLSDVSETAMMAMMPLGAGLGRHHVTRTEMTRTLNVERDGGKMRLAVLPSLSRSVSLGYEARCAQVAET
jgi:hypothetical protein